MQNPTLTPRGWLAVSGAATETEIFLNARFAYADSLMKDMEDKN